MADPFLEDQFASPPRRDGIDAAGSDAGSYAAHRRRRSNSRHSRRASVEPEQQRVPPVPTMSFPTSTSRGGGFGDAAPMEGEEYLPPMTGPSSRRRQRYDSVESYGSSVMPAALPYAAGGGGGAGGGGMNGGQQHHSSKARSSSRTQRQREREGEGNLLSPTSGGGLESWLRSQGSAGVGAGAESAQGYTSSFAPQGRVRRMGSEAGSAAGEGSVGGWSQGTTSRRNHHNSKYKREERVRSASSRGALKEVYEGPDDTPQDNLQRWLTSSALPSHAPPSASTTRHRAPSNAGSGLPSSISRHSIRAALHRDIASVQQQSATQPMAAAALTSPTPLRSLVRGLMKENVPATSIVLIALALNSFLQYLIARSSAGTAGWETLRHWMSLTTNVPSDEWYAYDLDHRLLDRPPLASGWAYAAGRLLSSSYPEVEKGLRFPPRPLAKGGGPLAPLPLLSLLASLICYAGPVLFFLHRRLADRGRRTRAIAILSILSQPAFSLVSFGLGGLQPLYLGMATLAMGFWLTSLPNPGAAGQGRAALQRITTLSRRVSYNYVAGFATYLWAVGLDQTCLAFAPAVGALLLGRWVGLASVGGVARGATLTVGLVVVAGLTFLVLFWPWVRIDFPGQGSQSLGFEATKRVLDRLVSQAWRWDVVVRGSASSSSSSLEAGDRTFYGSLSQALDLDGTQLQRIAIALTTLGCLYPFLILFRAARQTVQIEMRLYEDSTRDQAAARPNGSTLASASASASGPVTGNGKARLREPSRSSRSHRASSVAPSDAGSDLRSFAESMIKGGSSMSLAGTAGVGYAGDGVIGGGSKEIGVPVGVEGVRVASSCPSPSAAVIPYAFLAVALSVYLFSPPAAQGAGSGPLKVLLPLLPLTLLMVAKGDEYAEGRNRADWAWAALGNNCAVLSLWPLVRTQRLGIPGLGLVLVWNWLIGHRPFSPSASQPSLSRLAHAAILVAQGTSLLVGGITGESSPIVWTMVNLVTTPVWFAVYVWSLLRIGEVALGCGVEVGFGMRGGGSGKQQTRTPMERKVR